MFYHLLILLIFKIFINLKQLYFKEKYYNSHFNLKVLFLFVISLREYFIFNFIIFILYNFQIKIYKLINY